MSLPSVASPWNGKFGRVEGLNTTSVLWSILKMLSLRGSFQLYQLQLVSPSPPCSQARAKYLSLFSFSCFSLYGPLRRQSPQFCRFVIVTIIIIIIIIIIIYFFRVFHISISGWSFTGVWVTASLLNSPGLVSVFWPFSVMLLFG